MPLQAAASLLAGGARVWTTLLLLGLLFATLLILSNSSVFVYRVLVQMNNTGVAPVVGVTKWLLLLLDFGFRLIVPIWNAWFYLLGQILRRVILPYSFGNVDALPELLQDTSTLCQSCCRHRHAGPEHCHLAAKCDLVHGAVRGAAAKLCWQHDARWRLRHHVFAGRCALLRCAKPSLDGLAHALALRAAGGAIGAGHDPNLS